MGAGVHPAADARAAPLPLRPAAGVPLAAGGGRLGGRDAPSQRRFGPLPRRLRGPRPDREAGHGARARRGALRGGGHPARSHGGHGLRRPGPAAAAVHRPGSASGCRPPRRGGPARGRHGPAGRRTLTGRPRRPGGCGGPGSGGHRRRGHQAPALRARHRAVPGPGGREPDRLPGGGLPDRLRGGPDRRAGGHRNRPRGRGHRTARPAAGAPALGGGRPDVLRRPRRPVRRVDPALLAALALGARRRGGAADRVRHDRGVAAAGLGFCARGPRRLRAGAGRLGSARRNGRAVRPPASRRPGRLARRDAASRGAAR